MSSDMDDFDMHDIYQKRPPVRDVLNKCHVIQIRTLAGKKICSCVYDNETLYDLYKKCYETLFKTTNQMRVEQFQTVRDEIPNQPYQVIHDIVVVDKNDNMISIPCDPNINFYDFKRANERYFVPSSKVPVLSVYKIYVVDNEALEDYLRKQENKPITVIDKMKRYLNCVF
jgi:hypothetical protein